MDEWDLIGRVGYLLGNILFSIIEGCGLTDRVWAFPFFQIRVLGLTSRDSVWAAMKGYGRGTDPIALWAGEWNTWPISLSLSIVINMVTIYNYVFTMLGTV